MTEAQILLQVHLRELGIKTVARVQVWPRAEVPFRFGGLGEQNRLRVQRPLAADTERLGVKNSRS